MKRQLKLEAKLPNVKIEGKVKEEFAKYLDEDKINYSDFVREKIEEYIKLKKEEELKRA